MKRRTLFPPMIVLLSILLAAVGFLLWRLGLLQNLVGTKGFASVAFLLSAESILFGVYSLWAGKNQRHQLKELWGSSSTRYVGPFPHHLAEILKVVEHAREELLIMADCADYGSFSDPSIHDRLLKAIQQTSRSSSMGGRSIRVRMVLFAKRALSSNSPFYGRNFENDLRQDKTFNQALKTFLDFHRSSDRPKSELEFESMLLREQSNVESNLRDAGVEIGEMPREREEPRKEIIGDPGVFCWMADDVEALFVLATVGSAGPGLAFRTHDSTLINVFRSTFLHLESNCQPCPPLDVTQPRA